MSRILFAGSWWTTLGAAAAAYAATVLPEPAVIEPHEDADAVALDLIAYWTGEAQKIGEDVTPEGAEPAEWEEACHRAIVERIAAWRAED
jgi:hypothetical protein